MEALNGTLRRQKRRSRCIWTACGILVVVVLIAIIVPLAVTLPGRSSSKGLHSKVLVPLYVYPDPGAWDPLYAVVNASSRLNFTVIINPENGPGSSPSPGPDYLAAIQTLNAFTNVQTIGYVHTNYTMRNIADVLRDVATVAGWSTLGANMSMHGIFFDEIPSDFSTDAVKYLKTINEAAQTAAGIHPDRLIVHNPGTVPDSGLIPNSTDVIVAFEDSYQAYQSERSALATLPLDRSRYSAVVHSVPESVDLRKQVDQMSERAEYLFATSLSQDYYNGFGPDWETFVSVVPT